MTTLRSVSLPALVAVALAATGCGGLTNPYDKHAASPSPTAAAPPPPVASNPVTSAAPAVSADGAIRRFATKFINWKFDQLPAVKTALVAQATGPLATQLRKDAAQALSEISRRASNAANHGTVRVVDDSYRPGHFIVVTYETAILGDSASQAGAFVYRATAARDGNTYKLTSFEALN